MIELTQGEAKNFVITIENEFGERFDLTSFDEYKVCLPQSPSGHVEITEAASVSGSVVSINGSAVLGELLVALKPGDSDLLLDGKYQTIYVEINQSGDPTARRRWSLVRSLTVYEYEC